MTLLHGRALGHGHHVPLGFRRGHRGRRGHRAVPRGADRDGEGRAAGREDRSPDSQPGRCPCSPNMCAPHVARRISYYCVSPAALLHSTRLGGTYTVSPVAFVIYGH